MPGILEIEIYMNTPTFDRNTSSRNFLHQLGPVVKNYSTPKETAVALSEQAIDLLQTCAVQQRCCHY